ncbi:TRAP transporter small permease (plasmid) [Agrobacterium salinitolerans]|uniref:TRAP transporter small permease n=1 Tax=Agrobacterium TaxID=357 RepID=UPI0011EC8EB1|nr:MULTISPECIES: TRAP transporter small permease subunit [Agrobacterium]QXC52951.1 TRAP transporter small permease [Agrobacterium salinitolerans]TZG32342.1 TRAP transporter small permease [Agrobacterium sp. B1(2019)]
MTDKLRPIGAWLRRRAENLLALMLLAMFVAFLLQILFRYALNLSVGWTNELSVVLWMWLVLFGSAFVIREIDEIRFDLLWASATGRMRRAMQIMSSLALVTLFGISLPGVIDYVSFMKVESTAYMKIRFDYLYSIYVVFAVAMIIRYVWLGVQALRSASVDDDDNH